MKKYKIILLHLCITRSCLGHTAECNGTKRRDSARPITVKAAA